jgi:chromosome condensin MukBEF ATPase and DNA-binding subunit MukB
MLTKTRSTKKALRTHKKKSGASLRQSKIGFREQEMNWLDANNKLLRDEYRGEWVVVEKDELVAHNADYMKAVEVARRKGIKIPFTVFVERNDLPFVGV